MSYHGGRPTIDQEDRRQVLKLLGFTGAAAAASELTLDEMREGVGTEGAAELATMGSAIRADLTGSLDAALLGGAVGELGGRFERLPQLAALGFPETQGTEYADLVAPGVTAYEHLTDVGFFESVETHLPGFTADHIQDTARELVRAEALTGALADVGFAEEELTALVTNVVSEADRLAMWVPTKDIPQGVEFDVDAVAPVHQRAAGGALLWVEALDQHLWQKQFLLTEELLEQGLWDVKAMLGGLYLVTRAADTIAGNGDLTESQLTAALTGGSAIMILAQQDITADLYRITEEMRAPRAGGD